MSIILKPGTKYHPNEMFTVTNDGFYGVYYEPEKNMFPGKGMVVCSGTDGSFLFARLGAEKFLEVGMPVIALGYWNQEDTPDEPLNIPVEYMHRACLWLKNEKWLHPGVWGISLGGLYTLLCGSLFPDIECVVAASPVHIVIQTGSFNNGLHFADGSPFSYKGEPLPYAGVTDEQAADYLNRMKRNFLKTFEPDMRFYYEEVLQSEHDPAADVRVENINGPVLLISGGSDVMVPANRCCEQVMKRLDQHGFKYPHVHKNYYILSHYTAMFRPMSSGMFRVERRHRKECDANRETSWKYTLRFLREEWRI